ncbi:AzlC family ABC transporter permease [Paenibacillus senegalimassiliensis]|uniref:AzlC family ABC transporter permease n=1 Tax=Paenibacillus senegalimassiliensis TaxID=1737426 RepID=UPI00073ECFD4|nr:AzlC family ABC transporter permease [Paenibacillus senegalimassiliensis]
MNHIQRKEDVAQAMRDALPIVIAYFPLSMTYGVLASAGGLHGGLAMLGSVWIFSGGAQFMLLGMLTSASAPVTIVTTLLLLNLRHVLYGATMGPYLTSWREPQKWLAAIGLTDEGFAVTSSRAAQGNPLTPAYYISFALLIYGSWVAGTSIGIGLGSFVNAELATILSFALPALFIALLAGGDRTRASMLAAVSGALVAVLASMLHSGGLGLVLGGVVGATVGQQWTKRSRRAEQAN